MSRPPPNSSANRRHACGFSLAAALVALVVVIDPLPSAPALASDGEWTSTDLTIVNGSASAPLVCQFLLAHWFEVSIGPIPPGDQATQALLVRSATGDVAILNEVGDHMAVERLICGQPGSERAFWTEPAVDRLRTADRAITLRCRLGAARADCQYV